MNEEASKRVLGRDEPGAFSHDVETMGSFKARGGGLNQLSGPLSCEKWFEIPHRTADPTAWGTNERGRTWFDSENDLFKFWDGTQILGLMIGPAEGYSPGAIPFGDPTGGGLIEDATNLIWNDALNVLEVLAPIGNVYIGKGVVGAGDNTGQRNVYVGYEAGHDNTSGLYNVLVGYFAGRLNTSGLQNTYVGYLAGHNTTTSQKNTCIGAHAGPLITTGQGMNTLIGLESGGSMTTGKENVAVGKECGDTIITGLRNTFIGAYATGYDSDSQYRIAIGYQATSKEDNLCAIGGPFDTNSVSVAIFCNREFRWYDYDIGGNHNYVGFKAPTLTASQIWALPAADGAAGEVLSTSGEGVLGWQQSMLSDPPSGYYRIKKIHLNGDKHIVIVYDETPIP